MKQEKRNNKWLKARNKRKARAAEFAKCKRDAGVPRFLWVWKEQKILRGEL